MSGPQAVVWRAACIGLAFLLAVFIMAYATAPKSRAQAFALGTAPPLLEDLAKS
jgi:hypothetical protein